jgi:hypothetical protein
MKRKHDLVKSKLVFRFIWITGGKKNHMKFSTEADQKTCVKVIQKKICYIKNNKHGDMTNIISLKFELKELNTTVSHV